MSHGLHACGIVGSGAERLRMVSSFVHSGLVAGGQLTVTPAPAAAVADRIPEAAVGTPQLVVTGVAA